MDFLKTRPRLLASLISVILLTTAVLLVAQKHITSPNGLLGPPVIINTTFSSSAPKQSDHHTNVWQDLSWEECQSVVKWLHGPDSGLDLTPVAKSTSESNIILVTELLRPNKSDVLAFLDEQQLPPPRYARVSVKMNALDPPVIAEYQVGPLGPGETAMAIQPLVFPFDSGRSTTVNPAADIGKLQIWLDGVAQQMEDVLADLFRSPVQDAFAGSSSSSDRKPRFEVSASDQRLVENGRTFCWATFFQETNSSSSTVLPQGLYFKADITGRQPDNWKVILWLYDNIVYNSTAEFRDAWKKPGFNRTPVNLEGVWTHLEDGYRVRESPPPTDDDSDFYSTAEPPKMVQTEPSRIFLDAENGFVAWMGIRLNYAFQQASGLTLHDVRIDGQRVIYELGLQEAMAHYAGHDPVQSHTAFLDSLYGFGAKATQLVPGFDCPAYAAFADLTFHRMEHQHVRRRALCVFETPLDYPLARHSRARATTVFRHTALVLRTIFVVGNYDYLLDYVFYVDGTFEIRVRATGYIQGAYFGTAAQRVFGNRLREAFSSSIHDHVLNFKVDLDILGTNNTLTRLRVVPGTEKTHHYPWVAPGEAMNTMELHRDTMPVETALNWEPGTMYLVGATPEYPEHPRHGTTTNEALPEPPSYRIVPVTPPIHLTVQNSTVLQRAAAWADHELFVTHQKDSEPRSSVPANALDPANPLVDFARFVDGEPISQGDDLVLWLNLGMHHVPHLGDLPNTLTTTSTSAIQFVPYNYFARDRARGLATGVHLQHTGQGGDDDVWTVTALGAGQGPVSLVDFSASPRAVNKYLSDDAEVTV